MKRSVVAILSQKHGIGARPGGKVDCPFCGKRTFSIKRDDTLGKCFHPACGRFVTPGQYSSGRGSVLFPVLTEVFQDFHRALIEQAKDENTRNAYNYCVRKRLIHPKVVADSMLGVVPCGYDVDERFRAKLEELQQTAEGAKGAPKPKGRPPKRSGPSAEEQLAFLREARDTLEERVGELPGWLCFFYTDARHQVVAIRFREPYSKKILCYKPTRVGGCFNHGLFTPYEVSDRKHLNELLIVVEGEFNQLQLQSLMARVVESEGDPPESGYVFSCAVGGVHNVDVDAVTRISPKPVICYDNDPSGSGGTLVESISKATTATAFTTPAVGSDLDSYIRSFGPDYQSAWKAVRGLIAGRKLHYRPYEAVRAEIDEVRRSESAGKGGKKQFEAYRQASDLLLQDLRDRGRFYNDGTLAYYFLRSENRLFEIGPDDVNLELALGRYGFAPSERIFRCALDAMRLESFGAGERTKVYSFSHFDVNASTLYLYDLAQQVYRIQPDSIDLVGNGTDGILFLHNPQWTQFKVGKPSKGISYIDKLLIAPTRFDEDRLTRQETSILFLAWFYSLFFPELFPTKTIIASLGQHGSGKSFLLRKIGMILYGPNFNVTPLTQDSKDFDAAITNLPFVAVDNSDDSPRWLNDRLAAAATGGTIKRRVYYTTNRLAEFPITAYIGITSRTPAFTREDVADRLLPLHLTRYRKFQSEAELQQEVNSLRNAAMTEAVGHLQEIVRALRSERKKSYRTGFRMADFASFSLKWAHSQGWGDKMEAILEKLAQEQTIFTGEGEPLVELLDLWLAQGEGTNVGREVSTAKLCRELQRLADVHRIQCHHLRSARTLGQRITNMKDVLGEFYEIGDEKGGGNLRYLSFRPITSHPPTKVGEGGKAHAELR